MKILTVVGNRPQFIKLAPLARKLKEVATHLLVHTGQHFDYDMSDTFFEKLGLPDPDYNLRIHGLSDGSMVGRMVAKIEEVILTEQPDLVIVYGDTNSTLAGALASTFARVPLAHIESGARSYRLDMPEERNRRLTDILSQFCFCVTQSHLENLKREAIAARCFVTGDLMLDSCLFWQQHGLVVGDAWRKKNKVGEDFSIVTIHRAENLHSLVKLQEMLDALSSIAGEIIFPVHPHTRAVMDKFGINIPSSLISVGPIGYFEMLGLLQRAKVVLTDSGGIQREAYYLGRPCLILRSETEWPETLDGGGNRLVGTSKVAILDGLKELAGSSARLQRTPEDLSSFGSGLAAERILEVLRSGV